MSNIKEFLLDNYIWIIVVIVLIIITIIGFLADKKKEKGPKQESVPPVPNPGVAAPPVQPAAPMTYQPQAPEQVNNLNGMAAPMAAPPVAPMPEPMPAPAMPGQMNPVVNNAMPGPVPVEPINNMNMVPNQVEPTPMVNPMTPTEPAPLSEQKPAFEPVAPMNMPMGEPSVIPAPIGNMNMVENQPINPMPGMINPMNMQQTPTSTPTPVTDMYNQGVSPQPIPNPGTPSPVAPIPTPSVPPVAPTPMPTPAPTVPTEVPANNGSIPPQPVSFVYGPQNNNNNNNNPM